jgi:predicted amidohydrolase
VSSGWPLPRIEHWDVLTRARAIEDQAWVVACNEVGDQPGIRLGGHSVVVDPKGTVVALAGEGEEFLVAEVDPDESSRWREQFPALKDIRVG